MSLQSAVRVGKAERMARKSKLHSHIRRPVVKETTVPGGKILLREDGAERFVPTASGGVPPLIYTREKTGGGKLQGKII